MTFVQLLVQDAAAGESYNTEPCFVYGKGCSVVELLLTTLCLRTASDRGLILNVQLSYCTPVLQLLI